MTAAAGLPWWLQDALTVGPHGLELDGHPLADLARQHGTPTYVYSAATVRRRFHEMRRALRSIGAPFRIQYAMKANRFGPLLDLVRAEGDLGIDACSPREVERALQHGFQPHEISVTAGMLSPRDLQAFAGQGVHLNLDTLSVLRRWSQTPGHGRQVGLRINPGVAIGWGEEPKLRYGNSKFGFDADAVLDAVTVAQGLALEVDTLHCHVGWGLQESAAPRLGQVFARLATWAREIPSVRVVNVGGGLCWKQREQDRPLPVQTWADLLAQHLGPVCRERDLTIACEPGTFAVASAGVLLAQVNTVETRASGTWLGIDAGHNVNVYAAHYGIPLAIAAVRNPLDPVAARLHVAGNVNEANDVFGRDVPLPEVQEGDVLALYPAGAYGASMASDHCMRGLPREVLV